MAKRKGPNLPEGDDGRTIVNMNVDGMPWYLEKREGPMPGKDDEIGRASCRERV